MRTGQRDLNNSPSRRRLSITYEELETLKKSITVSVLNEVRAEMENSSDLESTKDLVLSEIRSELMEILNPASLKTSILNELRLELKSLDKQDGEETLERKVKEMAGLQAGLVRELLDQKTVIKTLGSDVEKLSREIEELKNATPAPPPSISLSLLEDPLDFPPLSRKPKHRQEGLRENSSTHRVLEVREVPAPLPGTRARVQLKVKETEARNEAVPSEGKCEYIIAESGELKKQRPPSRMARQDKNSECEYIIAEKKETQVMNNESVLEREDEDAEIITCSRKIPNAQ